VVVGQELARLDTRQLQLSVDQGVANLTISQASLAKAKAGAEAADVAAAEAALASAEAAYGSAKNRLGLQDKQLIVAETDLKRAELALQDAQAAYDRVAWLPQIGMLPQSQALQDATLEFKRATANYQLQVANIDDTAFKSAASQVAQAKAQLEKLRRSPTPEDLAIAEAQVQQAQVGVDQANLRLEDAVIVAPFAGTVLSVEPKVGEMVSMNAPVIVLADLQRYYLEATVDETDVGRVQVGQDAAITSDSLPDLALQGKVTRVDLLGKLSQGVVSYGVRVELQAANESLRPGMTAIADITVARKESILVAPNRAIRRDSRGRYYAEVVSNGAVSERTVTIGVSNEKFTEVVAGLDEGEQVAVSSTSRSLLDQFGGNSFSFGGSGR
jgi:HlyD family secretion protein